MFFYTILGDLAALSHDFFFVFDFFRPLSARVVFRQFSDEPLPIIASNIISLEMRV